MRQRKIDDNLLLSLLKEGKFQKEIASIMNVSETAVSKRVKRLCPPPESIVSLSPKEQRFVIEKAKGKTNVEAALASYEAGSRESAKVIGSQMMNRPDIKQAIEDLLELRGGGRVYRVDRLVQHMGAVDPSVSLKALDMGFRLANDYPAQKNVNLNLNADIGNPIDLDEFKRR